jgi:hypothetical protein
MALPFIVSVERGSVLPLKAMLDSVVVRVVAVGEEKVNSLNVSLVVVVVTSVDVVVVVEVSLVVVLSVGTTAGVARLLDGSAGCFCRDQRIPPTIRAAASNVAPMATDRLTALFGMNGFVCFGIVSFPSVIFYKNFNKGTCCCQ